MLNTFLVLYMLVAVLVIRRASTSSAVRVWWEGHAGYTLLMLPAGGLAWLEGLWLHTLWPEARMGAAVLVSLWLLYTLFMRLWFLLHRSAVSPHLASWLGLFWLFGLPAAYLPDQPAAGWLILPAALPALFCIHPRGGALPVALLSGTAAMILGNLLLTWPEVAMNTAHTLPGHYNSLAVAGLLWPWLLVPGWLAWQQIRGPLAVKNRCFGSSAAREYGHD